MSSDELFEAVSHPLRIEIVKALAEKPLRFADLKRNLRISSSGLLGFHLKKLDDLITTNDEGYYSLTDRGFAALTTVESAAGYYKLRSAQKKIIPPESRSQCSRKHYHSVGRKPTK